MAASYRQPRARSSSCAARARSPSSMALVGLGDVVARCGAEPTLCAVARQRPRRGPTRRNWPSETARPASPTPRLFPPASTEISAGQAAGTILCGSAGPVSRGRHGLVEMLPRSGLTPAAPDQAELAQRIDPVYRRGVGTVEQLSDAQGHGLVPAARLLQDAGPLAPADWSPRVTDIALIAKGDAVQVVPFAFGEKISAARCRCRRSS